MIKRFKTNITEMKRRSVGNFRSMALESLSITVALIVIVLLLFSNIVRVITTGKTNYDTFLAEEESLAVIREKNEKLTDEYNYVNSDEAKKLILRDTLGVAEQSEKLFKTKDEIEYFDEEKEYFDLREIEDFSTWWEGLFRI